MSENSTRKPSPIAQEFPRLHEHEIGAAALYADTLAWERRILIRGGRGEDTPTYIAGMRAALRILFTEHYGDIVACGHWLDQDTKAYDEATPL